MSTSPLPSNFSPIENAPALLNQLPQILSNQNERICEILLGDEWKNLHITDPNCIPSEELKHRVSVISPVQSESSNDFKVYSLEEVENTLGLVAQEFNAEDDVINNFLQSIGPWNMEIVIGGSYALIIYRLYFKKSAPSAASPHDIDCLINRKIEEPCEKKLAQYLQEAGFSQRFKGRKLPPSESYFKTINGIEVEVEFLTDDNTRGDRTQNVAISHTGVVAQPLSYLQMSLANTKTFQTFSKTLGKVASPAAWMFHKGLTFPKRQEKEKIPKDLYGMWYVATQLASLSEETLEEFKVLSARHPKWFNTFCFNLKDWLKKANDYDWCCLRGQDLHGHLTQIAFKEMVEKLTS